MNLETSRSKRTFSHPDPASEVTAAPTSTGQPAARLELEIAGWSLIAGALSFWLSWFLMPQPGTTDAAYILAAVAGQRGEVLASAILQTLFAVLTLPAGLALARLGATRGRRLLYAGALLLLVGAVGNGADAVYHQVAYEMTAPDVDARAMVPVMTRLQTEDILLLAPLMLASLAGPVVLALGLARAGLASRGIAWLYAGALGVAVLGRVGMATMGLPPRPVSVAALGLVSAALAWTGWALRRAGRGGASPLSPRV